MFYLYYLDIILLVVFFTPIIIILIANLIILIINSIKKSNIRKIQEEINNKAKQAIASTNFKATKIYYINDYASYNQSENVKKMVLIDNDNKQMALINYNSAEITIIDFKDILNYEIYENKSIHTSGIMWGMGLLDLGKGEIYKDLSLIIKLNKINKPQIKYDIIFNTGINKSSKTYKDCVSTLQEFVSFLDVVKNQNKTEM